MLKEIRELTLQEIVDICNNQDGCSDCPLGIQNDDEPGRAQCTLKHLHYFMNSTQPDEIEDMLNARIEIDQLDNKISRNCETCSKAWTDACERSACYKNDYCKYVPEHNNEGEVAE